MYGLEGQRNLQPGDLVIPNKDGRMDPWLSAGSGLFQVEDVVHPYGAYLSRIDLGNTDQKSGATARWVPSSLLRLADPLMGC